MWWRVPPVQSPLSMKTGASAVPWTSIVLGELCDSPPPVFISHKDSWTPICGYALHQPRNEFYMKLSRLNRPIRLSVALAIAVLCLPGAALGQDDRGASVAGGVSATNMESRTSLSFSGAFAYRFSRVAGLELETTVVPTLKSEFPGVTIQNVVGGVSSSSAIAGELQYLIYPPPSFQNQRGRAVIFSNNVRISIPTTSSRLEPFFVAGGGIASVRHTADYVYSFPRLPVPLAGSVSPIPPLTTISQRVSSSSVGLALTLGGGLSVRVASQMAVEADLRLFRILGDEDTNTGRFGVGVRYRF
jgi:opacity protein-like surface antigen